MRVFIVEDEAFIVLNLKRQLLGSGYEICGVEATGERAVERMLGLDKPDIVIMDIGLAGSMNGIDTARAITAKKPIPVIFMSGYDEAEVRELSRDFSPAGFLAKPVSTDRLISCLEEAMKARIGQAGLGVEA